MMEKISATQSSNEMSTYLSFVGKSANVSQREVFQIYKFTELQFIFFVHVLINQ